VLFGLLDSPRQLIATARPGFGRFFAFKVNAGKRRDVLRAACCCVIKSLQKSFAGVSAPCRVRLVDRITHKAAIELKKHIGAAEAAVSQLAAKLRAGFSRGLETLRWLQMRAAFKQTDVHAIEPEHRN